MHLLRHSWLQVRAYKRLSHLLHNVACLAAEMDPASSLCCRGKFRSKPWQDVITEAKALVASGVKELNLIAGVLQLMLHVHIPNYVCAHAAMLLPFLDAPPLVQRTQTSMARTGGTARAWQG